MSATNGMNTMDRKPHWALIAAFLMAFALPGPAIAETATEASAEAETPAAPEQADETEAPAPMSDEDVAKSLVGKTYSGSLGVDGWTSQGGGLVLPPIYVEQFSRNDGKILVVTSKETAAAGRGSAATFEVADTLLVTKPRRGYTFSTACMKGEDYTLRFLGEVSGKDSAEMWTNLRKAWEIDIETGKITSLKGRGIKCTNPNW